MAKTKDRKEAAKEFGAGLLALIEDPAVKASVAKALESDAVLDHLGDGVLRQSDHTRFAQEAKAAKDAADAAQAEFQTKRTEITDWYKGQLEKANAAPADPNPNPAASALDPAKFVTREDLAKIVAAAQGQASANVIAWQQTLIPLSTKHFIDYKEPLDVAALIKFAGEQRLPVDQAYPAFTAEKRAAADAVRQKERDDKLIRETEDRVRSEFAGLPHLLPGNEPLGTLGGLLDDPKTKPDISVDGLVTAFNKIQAEKGRGA